MASKKIFMAAAKNRWMASPSVSKKRNHQQHLLAAGGENQPAKVA